MCKGVSDFSYSFGVGGLGCGPGSWGQTSHFSTLPGQGSGSSLKAQFPQSNKLCRLSHFALISDDPWLPRLLLGLQLLPWAGNSGSPGLWPGLHRKTVEIRMRVIHTLCSHLLMLSVCLAGITGGGSAEHGCGGGAGRKAWVGRILPSSQGSRRESGLRGKAETEDVIARAGDFIWTDRRDNIYSSIHRVIMCPDQTLRLWTKIKQVYVWQQQDSIVWM